MSYHKRLRISNNIKEVGRIISLYAGVGRIQGLPSVFLHEVLVNEAGVPAALVMGFDDSSVEAVFFKEQINTGHPLFRSKRPFFIPASRAYAGRVLNGFGRPLDSLGSITGDPLPVIRGAPPFIDRDPIRRPLITGIKLIDTTLPIGRGQRELILGDRKLGKSTLALDTILHQKHANPAVHCVYVLCGHKRRKLEQVIKLFRAHGTFAYTTIVAATAGDSLSAQYLAPFVGCAIGEYARDAGNDALVIYDDLTKHANVFRTLSLLFKRPPGREAFPGEIFSLHAGLLERAAQLSKKKGGGSLTALPIVETQEEDITAFIPTNLISITDGQIYLERGLFQKGFLPAVNVGLSVSRVGSRAQPKPLQEVTKGLRLALSQQKELQKLSQLETTVSRETVSNIHRGELILTLLKQKRHLTIRWEEQAVLFYAVEQGYFDDMKMEQSTRFEGFLLELLRNRYPNIIENVRKTGFTKKSAQDIEKLVSDFKQEFFGVDD